GAVVRRRAGDRCERRAGAHLARPHPAGQRTGGAGRRPPLARQAPLGDRLSRQGHPRPGEALVNAWIRRAAARGLITLVACAAIALAALPARAMNIERVVSPLGIEAWLVSDRTLPLIAVDFAFLGSADQDPQDKPGIAHMATSLLDDGAGPNDMASRDWWATAFPGHPYGQPVSGTLESVPAITVDDLKSYTRRALARDNLKIAVVGDIDAATAARLIDRTFGALPAKAELKPVAPVVAQGLGRRVVIDLDVPQAVVNFGGPGIARSDPDF